MRYLALILVTLMLLELSIFDAQAQTVSSTEICELSLVGDEQHPKIYTLDLKAETRFIVPNGRNRLRLNCALNQQSIFTFDQSEVMNVEVANQNVPLVTLRSTSPSFLLPAGEFIAEFDIEMHANTNKVFKWQNIEQFLYESLLSTITMGAFYGLCLVLILYVSFMGNIVGDKSFHLYSLYVFCAATFFLLQEGQLNIFLPQQSFLFDHSFYLLFAGLTVFSATVFIINITDIRQTWPQLVFYVLYPAAIIVLLISVYLLFTNHGSLSVFLGVLMGRITLAIMIAILVLVMVQTYRRVKMAWLVCLSICLMVGAMIVRVLPIDAGYFIERYSLIMAFAIEAFIFAIVVSSKLQRIKVGQQRAEAQANTDSLCNVLNRRGWMTKAEELLELQKQKGGILGLLYIDLDDFKSVNDIYGHDSGDRVLIILAKIIKNKARTNDAVGRIGGDEFVMLGHFDTEHESQMIASRMSQRLQDMNLQINSSLNIKVSASVGHMAFVSPPQNVNTMLSSADRAMYQNKRNNRMVETTTIHT